MSQFNPLKSTNSGIAGLVQSANMKLKSFRNQDFSILNNASNTQGLAALKSLKSDVTLAKDTIPVINDIGKEYASIQHYEKSLTQTENLLNGTISHSFNEANEEDSGALVLDNQVQITQEKAITENSHDNDSPSLTPLSHISLPNSKGLPESYSVSPTNNEVTYKIVPFDVMTGA